MNVRLLASATLLAVATIAVPSTVAAKDTDVIRTGSCSGAADWKLKAHKDDGRIEVEFEVDSNRNGQEWRVKILDNDVLRHRAIHTTHGPSGSFSVERKIANMSGKDHIVARARNLNSGQTCVGNLTL